MMKLKVALAALFVSLFGAVGLAVSHGTAHANPAFYPSDCANSAYICYYESSNGSGGWDERATPGNYAKSVCYSATSVLKLTRYISNPTSSNFVVYLNSSCSGTSAPIYAHSSGAMNSQWAAKIRSIVRVS